MGSEAFQGDSRDSLRVHIGYIVGISRGYGPILGAHGFNPMEPLNL